MRTTDYNGYKNHATWYVATHFVLDEGGLILPLIEDMHFNGMAFDIVKQAHEMRALVRSWTIEDEACNTCAKWLSEYFHDQVMDNGDSFSATFARFWAEDIDWWQIAAHAMDWDDMQMGLGFAVDIYAISQIPDVESILKARDLDFRSWTWDELSCAIDRLKDAGYKCATDEMEEYKYEDVEYIKE